MTNYEPEAEVECHKCGEVIPRQWPEFPEYKNLDNELVVEFHGGYGSFTDCVHECPAHKIILCHRCSHYLCEFLDINPSNWHTHIPDSGQHPDHHDR